MHILRRNKRRHFVISRLACVLTDKICNLSQINKKIGNVNEPRSSIRPEPGHFYAAALVRDGIDRVDKVFIAGDEHRRIITASEAEHVHGYLNIQIRFACTVVEGLELLLNDTEAISAHPKQKSLLSFCTRIDTGIEKCAKQPP